MAMPSTAINRFDLSLTYGEFSEILNRQGFIGLRVFPAAPVAKQSSEFARVNIESLLTKVEVTKRAPKSAYKRDDFEWGTDNFATEDHGVEEEVDDRSVKMYGSELKAEAIHTRRAVNRVAQAFENEVATKTFNTSTWTGSALTTTVATPWTTKASCKPIDDIDGAIEKVKASCGTRPNSLVITDLNLRHMKRSAQVEDLLKYSGKDDPKDLGLIAGLRQLLDIENIIVAMAFKNTADQGQSASLSRLWTPGMAMVCCINTDGDIESPNPTLGYTMMWTEENGPIPGAEDPTPGVIIEEYREENRRGSVIRARNDRVIKVLHPEAGHLLQALSS